MTGSAARCGEDISVDLHVRRPCCRDANRHNKERDMQTDLREFVARLLGTVVMTLIPVVLVTFLSMPANLHHHIGNQPNDPNAPAAHMS
jgi:hypothetical protein